MEGQIDERNRISGEVVETGYQEKWLKRDIRRSG
jgi:hypothetical protein